MRLDPVVATRLLFPVPLDYCGVVYACEATYEYYDSPPRYIYRVEYSDSHRLCLSSV